MPTRVFRHSLAHEEKAWLQAFCDAPDLVSLVDADQKELVAATSTKLAVGHPPGSQFTGRLSDPSQCGLLIVEDLPMVRYPKILAVAMGELLGPVTKYPAENDYLVEIREQPVKAGDRPSFRNTREFFLHTDMSYDPSPPPFFLMHSVVANEGLGGYSTFCDVNKVVARLNSTALRLLQESNFFFDAPAHYRGAPQNATPILTKHAAGYWQVRFRRDGLRAVTRESIVAVIDLLKAFKEETVEVPLRANSLIFINNQTFLHGRTAFENPTTAEHARFFIRAYVSDAKTAFPTSEVHA